MSDELKNKYIAWGQKSVGVGAWGSPSAIDWIYTKNRDETSELLSDLSKVAAIVSLREEFLKEFTGGVVKTSEKPKESEILAVEEFLKKNKDIGRSKIRAVRASASKNLYELKLNAHAVLTVKKDSAYVKRDKHPPMTCNVDSLYVGKRSDVIFQMRCGNGEIVEMKLREAISLLDGFWEFIYELLKDNVQEMAEHYRKEEIRVEKERKEALLMAQKAAAEAKALKYAGKPFGAW